jgi:hypothetical protein
MLISTSQRSAECIRLLFSTYKRVQNLHKYAFFPSVLQNSLSNLPITSSKFLLEKLKCHMSVRNFMHYMAAGSSLPYLEQTDKGSNLRQLNPSHTLTSYTCNIRADSHYTSRCRSVAERHRSVKLFSCVIKWRCSH